MMTPESFTEGLTKVILAAALAYLILLPWIFQ
jgi:hypothetical protein